MKRLHVLVLNGETFSAGLLKNCFRSDEVSICETTDLSQVILLSYQKSFNMVILDLPGKGENVVPLLKRIKEVNSDIEIFLISDFIPSTTKYPCGLTILKKGVSRAEIVSKIERSRSFEKMKHHSRQMDLNFQRFSKEVVANGGQQIIGSSNAVKSIAGLILLISQAEDTSVLITGESGTGKELVARGIHALSARDGSHFHPVNCSAIPDSLFESEFFGYRKGAFTGALEKSTGWFELSNQGTLFLDEITELPLCMQSKFLRVLDDKTIHRIGSHQEVKLKLRIISATNQDFDELLSKKLFREDLYHRLNSFHIHIPPLRERREDIPILLNHFISVFSEKFRKNVKKVDNHAMEMIMSYHFPGNVRELKNLVERAVIVSEDKILNISHFNFTRNGERAMAEVNMAGQDLKLCDLEKNAILAALRKSNNNKSEAARLLSISRQSLDRRLMRFQLI